VTADDLSKELFTDQKAAADKYKNKWIQVEGGVYKVKKAYGHVELTLRGAPPKANTVGCSIDCLVVAADIEKVWQFGKNQKVSVFGRVQGFGPLLSLDLAEATVKELEPSKLIRLTAEELAAEYAKQPMVAHEKYTGDSFSIPIVLTGTVAELIDDDGSKIVVLTGTGNTQPRVGIYKDDWATLKKGDKVTIRAEAASVDVEKANSPKLDAGFLIKKD